MNKDCLKFCRNFPAIIPTNILISDTGDATAAEYLDAQDEIGKLTYRETG